MHIPTFSPDGTFDGALTKLSYLLALGITTIELMPVTEDLDTAWGYSLVHLWAVSSRLGGYDALRRFVNGAHRLGLEVILDVVYNHDDGRTLLYGLNRCESNMDKESLSKAYCPSNGFVDPIPCDFGSYFYSDERQMTPWGPRFDYSSGTVYSVLVSNLRYWVEEVGVDGLRINSTICVRKTEGTDNECWQTNALDNDDGSKFLRDSANYLSSLGKLSIAEDLQGDAAITADDGLGFDAQWDDSLYHGVNHAFYALANEAALDFDPFSKIFTSLSAQCASGGKWISYTETHDIAATHHRTAFLGSNYVQDAKHLVSAQLFPLSIAMLSCGTPMLFQGQEIGEMREFDFTKPPPFHWDLQADLMFSDSGSICSLPKDPKWELFRRTSEMVHAYKQIPALWSSEIGRIKGFFPASVACFTRGAGGNIAMIIWNLDQETVSATLEAPLPGSWTVVFDSTAPSGGSSLQSYESESAGILSNLVSLSVPAMSTLILAPGDMVNVGDLLPKALPGCSKMALAAVDISRSMYFDQTWWRSHMSLELFPFWDSLDALGSVYGDFPHLSM